MLGDQAVPAAVASLMDVEEGHRLADGEGFAFNISHFAAGCYDLAYTDVPWNERIRHAAELAVPEMNVRAADFGGEGFEEDGARLEVWNRRFANLYRLSRSGNDGMAAHGAILPIQHGGVFTRR